MIDELSDPAAERGVLSLIVKHGKDAYLEVSDFIKSTTFTYPPNQFLYGILSNILNADLEKKIDLGLILSTAKDLGISGQLSEDKYLQKILSFNTELSNIKGFARKIRILEEGRNILAKFSDTQETIKKISGNETISELKALAEKPIFEYTDGLLEKGGIGHASEGLDEYYEYLKNASMDDLSGIDIGFPIYQSQVGGITPGVHLISARKKTGKSFKAMNAGLFAAAKGKNPVPVWNGDTEMKKETGWWARALSRISGVPINDIRYGLFRNDENKIRKIEKAKEILKSIPYFYENLSNRSFDETLSMIRRWLLQSVGFNEIGDLNRCLVVYDWLKISDSNDISKNIAETQSLGFKITKLNDLALKYKFPILLFTQQNRELDIAMSDRLSWFSTSCASLSKKTQDEIITDGMECGNLKLVVTDARNDGGSEMGDYINFNLYGKIAQLKELGLNSVMQKMREQNEQSE